MSQLGSFRSLTDSDQLRLAFARDPTLYDLLFNDTESLDSKNTDASAPTLPQSNPNEIVPPEARLNVAAFGVPYQRVTDLATRLRAFASAHPDVFYDQALHPLLARSQATAENFFDCQDNIKAHLCLVPNCSMGMKAVLETLIRTQKHDQIAYLAPLYPATANLLETYLAPQTGCSVKSIGADDAEFWFEESAEKVLDRLRRVYARSQFSLLVADEVSSQTGRQLPLGEVAEWCEGRGVVLVVDGTQGFDFQPCVPSTSRTLEGLESSSSKLDFVDYYVMSTHKWVGNGRTCGIVRWRSDADVQKSQIAGADKKVVLPPLFPPAVSFGYTSTATKQSQPLSSNALPDSRFSWLGMLDSYISYITLHTALTLFTTFGPLQVSTSSALLKEGLSVLAEGSMFTDRSKPRLIETIAIHNVKQRFFPELLLDDQKNVTAAMLQEHFQRVHGVYVSVKAVENPGCGANGVCGRITPAVPKTDTFFVRVSAWSGNTLLDFQRFANVLNHNVSLRDLVLLLKAAYPDEGTIKKTALSTLALQRFRDLLKHYLRRAYANYDALFRNLKPKAFFVRGEKLRHHLIFYVGHTACFYVNKFLSAGFLLTGVDRRLEALFAVGVDEMSWDDILEENYDWCGLDQAALEKYLENSREYRKKVWNLLEECVDGYELDSESSEGPRPRVTENKTVMRELLRSLTKEELEVSDPQALSLSTRMQDSLLWILLMGVEHENIHQETSCPIISQLPLELLNGGDSEEDNVLGWRLKSFAELGERERWILDRTSGWWRGVSSAGGKGVPVPGRLLETKKSSSDDNMSKGSFLVKGAGRTSAATYPFAQNSFSPAVRSSSEISTSASTSEEQSPSPSQKAASSEEERCFYTRFGNPLVTIRGGSVKLGKQFSEADFYGWDNEFLGEVSQKPLEDFKASQTLVSNLEFKEFMVEGKGYQTRNFWSDEGWRFVQDMKVDRPRFWSADWQKYRLMTREVPLDWNMPAEVSNLEAEAFCNWKSSKLGGRKVRLMSHEEQFLLRTQIKNATANANMKNFASASPVDYFCAELCGDYSANSDTETTASASGQLSRQYVVQNREVIYDPFGSVWRHSCSVLTLMPGFKPHKVYDDFTLPTIDGNHSFILGGSWTSVGNQANAGSRYGFRRHFYQFAGIRYVVSPPEVNDSIATTPEKFFKENGRVIAMKPLGAACSEHYSEFWDADKASGYIVNAEALPTEIAWKPVGNFPRIFGEIARREIERNLMSQKIREEEKKVLVAHGSVGRVVLELLKSSSPLNLTYTDPTANALQVLETLLTQGRIRWTQQLEGVIGEMREFSLANALGQEENADNVTFLQVQNYLNVREGSLNDEDFHALVVDFRFRNAQTEFRALARKVKVDGLLIVATVDSPDLYASDSGLERIKGFESSRFPHIFRETRSKHQYAVSEVSVWKKVKSLGSSGTSSGLRSETALSSASKTNHSQETSAYYRDDGILQSYEDFHFRDEPFFKHVQNFPVAVADFCLDACSRFGKAKFGRALDAGCGPGRSSMHLVTRFQYVEGFDYAQGFIDMAQERVGKYGPDKVVFYQGDAHKLGSIVKSREQFDLILACNLIDRLEKPKTFLEQAKERVGKGGLLVICSPYTWKEAHTKEEEWIGGKFSQTTGEKIFTEEGLKEALGQGNEKMEWMESKKIPFVIPDSDGTYQFTFSNCTVFKKL